MEHTLGYRLFGAGALPAEVAMEVGDSPRLVFEEGIKVEERFQGTVPGLHENGRSFRYSGAILITVERVIGSIGTWVALDAPWQAAEPGPVQILIDAKGVRLDADMSSIDPQWTGHLTLVFQRPISEAELASLPARSLRCTMTAAHVLMLAGAKPKRHEATGA